MYRILITAAMIASASAAVAQMSTRQQTLAAKLNCADFKRVGNGSWVGNGRTYSRSNAMSVALQQKCTGKTKKPGTH